MLVNVLKSLEPNYLEIIIKKNKHKFLLSVLSCNGLFTSLNTCNRQLMECVYLYVIYNHSNNLK